MTGYSSFVTRLSPWPNAESSIPTQCGNCWRCGGQLYVYLVHHCTTALPMSRLSPLGGGPNPWGSP